jgi:polar amino acid transport system substrate-binding protein
MNRRLLSVCLLCLPLLQSAAAAQPSDDTPRLRVGTKEAPPFALKRPDGSWTGISVELWRAVATELGYTFELHEYDLTDLLNHVADGSVDVGVAALTITPEREGRMDFTHPFHVSGLAAAVRADAGSGWLKVLSHFLSVDFLQIVLALAALLLVVGLLLWAFERRENQEHFGGSPAQGIGSSFWWSAVTMTTVGYGDKAPRTLGGRLVALVWMFAGLIVISSFTAAITAGLTVERLGDSIQVPEGLAEAQVGTVPGSTSAAYLDWRQIPFAAFDSPHDALVALREGRLDAVVYDAPILRFAVRHRFGSTLEVLPTTFERQYYGFALPAGSPLREPINRVLLNRITRPDWQTLIQRYLGQEAAP